MKITVTSLLLIALFCAPAAGSNLVTFQFVATVDSVDDSLGVLGGYILAGDTLTGVLQYDLDLPDSNSGSDVGYYDATPPGDNFVDGSNGASGNFETVDFFGANVENDGFSGEDRVNFYASGDTTPSTLAHPSVDWVDLDIVLADYDGTVFSGDSLPASLNLADFEEASLWLSAERWDEDLFDYVITFEVAATITSITPVPEPSTLLLGTIATVGLLLRRRHLS